MVTTLLALVLAAPDVEAAPAPREITPAVLFDRMAKECDQIFFDYGRGLHAAKTLPDKGAAEQKFTADLRSWAERSWTLVLEHPGGPAAFDFLATLCRLHREHAKVVRYLRAHHAADPRVGRFVPLLALGTGPEARRFAEEVADRHPDRAVQGTALYDLGRTDRTLLAQAARPKGRLNSRYGPPDEFRARAEGYLARVVKDYTDVLSDGEPLGTLAAAELAGLRNVGRLEVGNRVPAITGEDMDGKPLTFDPAGGKVTVLVFWNTRCGPCLKLVPREKALAEKYRGQAFALVGANNGDDQPTARKAMADKGMTWPSFYGGERWGSALAAEWNVAEWPTVYVFDPAGVIRYKGNGDGLEAAVEACMAKLDPAAK